MAEEGVIPTRGLFNRFVRATEKVERTPRSRLPKMRELPRFTSPPKAKYLKILAVNGEENGEPIAPSSGQCVYSAEICNFNSEISFCNPNTEPWEGTGELVWVVQTGLTAQRSLIVNERYLGYSTSEWFAVDEDARQLYAIDVPQHGLPTFGNPLDSTPYGIAVSDSTLIERSNGSVLLRVRTPKGLSQDFCYFVNGPDGYTSDALRSMPGDRPVRAAMELYGFGESSFLGKSFGCIAGAQKLSPGLPGGWKYIGGFDSATDTGLFVLDDAVMHWAVAKSDWEPETNSNDPSASRLASVVVYPAMGMRTDSLVYNGSGALPSVELTLLIHYDESQQPIILEGDLVQYCRCLERGGAGGSSPPLGTQFQVPPGAYLGPPQYTVRMWASATIPRGWAEMNGTDNSSDNGGSGIDMRGRFPLAPGGTIGASPGGTGGTTTHTHNAHGTTAAMAGGGASPAANSNHSTANHVPPYFCIRFIERLTP